MNIYTNVLTYFLIRFKNMSSEKFKISYSLLFGKLLLLKNNYK